MLVVSSNFIEIFNPKGAAKGTALADYCKGRGCCQDIRQNSKRGWLTYVPTRWLEMVETSQEDMVLYVDFVNTYIAKFGCKITYLGIEPCKIQPYISGSNVNLEPDCHVFFLESDASSSEYSWKIYVSFILLRNLYISYGWPYSKAIISILKTKSPSLVNPEHIIGLGYVLGHRSTEYAKLKTHVYYSTNLSNQILGPTCHLKVNWDTKWNNTAQSGITQSTTWSEEYNATKMMTMLQDHASHDELIKYIFKLK
jgi:hypothetical protein